jgi:hypothetical protein
LGKVALFAKTATRARPMRRRTAPRPSFPRSRDRAVPGSIALCADSPLPGRGSSTPCPAPDWRGMHVPARRSMLASVAGEKPGRPQFVGIAEVLRLPARQRHQPCLGLQRDRRFPAGARAIVECSHRAFGHGALDATLDGLMMQSERPTDRKKRRVFPIGQQYPRPFDPARRLRSRLRYRSQLRRIRISERQFNRPPRRRHDTFYPVHLGHTRLI